MSQDVEFPDIESLAVLAKKGDENAAAQVLIAYLPYWMNAARSITGGKDPEDLVQEAVTRIIAAWRRNEGPDTNTRSYVTAMMRNAYAEHVRSPRSRVLHLNEFEQDVLDTHDSFEPLDLIHEVDAARRAFQTLSADHRRVLVATVVEGRKPGDLVEELGRPSPAISNLLARAKKKLRQALLIDYLSQGGPGCAANAEQLPKAQLEATIEEVEGTDHHIRDCSQCQSNWRRFAGITSALGVLPLLTVAELTRVAPPAQAVTQAEPTPQPRHTASPTPLTTAAASKTALVTGVLLVSAAVVALGWYLLANTQQESQLAGSTRQQQSTFAGQIEGAADPAASFDVVLDTDAEGALGAIHIVFEASPEQAWLLNELTLQLPSEVEISAASDELTCENEPGQVRCSTPMATTSAQRFTFDVVDHTLAPARGSAPRGTFSLAMTVQAEDDEYLGTAEGSW